jgi:dTDP-glucose 4,6-dehydratase
VNIFVTGALGIVGKDMVKGLKESGHNLFCIGERHTELPEEEYRRCDIRSMYQLERVFGIAETILGKIDCVYHLAAEFGRMNGEDYYDTLWNTNAVGTKNILVLQREKRFRLIFSSSSEIYGELPEGVPYREDIPEKYPLKHYNDYAMTKWVNEQQIRNDMERFGTESVILRFFNAYGEGEAYTQYRSVVSLFCYRLLNNLPITVYKDTKRDFMHIDDLVSTLVKVPGKFNSGEVYNLGGDDFRTIGELVDVIKKHVPETKSEIEYLETEFMNVPSKRPDIEKAKRNFGHNPVITLEEGVPRTINWMKKRYNI